MKRNLFSIIVIIRVILISLNSLVLIWFYSQTSRPATTIFFLLLIIYQTISLLFYLNRINRDLANFLVFLQENDTTLAFSRKRIERNFKGLIYHLNKINQKLQEARIGREQQYQYLQAVVEQVNTGIIASDNHGKIVILNRAARELLEISDIKNLTVLIRMYPEFDSWFHPEKLHQSPVKIKKGNGFLMLAVKTSLLRFDEKDVSLVSFQNIKPELETGELDAWRKLIRIQRHEIMNSITPVTTLTTTIRRRLKTGNKKKKLSDLTEEDIDDILMGVETIEERSHGLIGFMERFKRLTNIPELRITEFKIKAVLDHLAILFSNELETRNVSLKIEMEDDNLQIAADENMLEQVLINLVKNALEAMRPEGGEIGLKVSGRLNTVVLQVADNGTGIEPEMMESIFVPSFSTKDKGMGIGLSLCKQIIQLHGGTIRANSIPGSGTVMEITLPC
jgi:two-component system, NtrC family, nitrogen regulation sensor histidine kinase NtrY